MSSFTKLSRVGTLAVDEVIKCCTTEDLVIHCSDGKMRSHQWLFSQHSPYLHKIFLRFQVVEFVVNKSGELEPDSRRKGDCDVEIMLPDFSLEDLQTMILLFAGQEIKFRKEKLEKMKQLISLLQCKRLKIPSLHKENEKRPSVPTPCVSIKKEVLYEVQMKTEVSQETEKDESKKLPADKRTDKTASTTESCTDTQNKTTEATATASASQPPLQGKKRGIKRKAQVARKRNTKRPEPVVMYTEQSTVVWEDVPCIICGEEMQIRENLIIGNRGRYQRHLLGHFQFTIFQDIPREKELLTCEYDDCSYSGKTSEYIKHIALFHDEWDRRIKGRIEELEMMQTRDCETEDELEEWKQIVNFFEQDLRVRLSEPTAASTDGSQRGSASFKDDNTNSEKPTTVVKELPFDDHTDELNLLQQEIEVEQTIDIRKNEILDEDLEEGELELHSQEQHVAPSNNIISPVSDKSNRSSIDEFDSASQVAMKILEAVPLQENFDTEMEDLEDTIIEKESKICHMCDQVLARSHYVDHMVEIHCKDILFSDVTGTKCGHDLCSRNFETDVQLCTHLVNEHNELIPRIDRHLKDLKMRSLCEAEESPVQKLFIDLKQACLERQLVKSSANTFASHETGGGNSSAYLPNIGPSGSNMMKSSPLENLVPPEFIGCSAESLSTSDREDSIKASEEEKKSSSSSEVYGTPTCSPGGMPPASEKLVSSAASSLVIPDRALQVERPPLAGGSQSVPATPSSRSNVTTTSEIRRTDVSIATAEKRLAPSTSATRSTVSFQRDHSSSAMEDIFLKTGHHLGYKCLSCSKYSSTKPDILAHIIENHLGHMFKDIPVQDEYTCDRDGHKFKTRVGMMTHNILKHLDTFGEARDHMVNLIGTVDFGSQVGTISVVGGDEPAEFQGLLQREIKQEIIRTGLNPILETDQSILSWSCKECSQEFSDEDTIRKHVVLEHLIHDFDSLVPLDKKIYDCTYCHDHASTDRKQYILHLSSVHSVVEEEKIYSCIKESRTLLLDIDVIRCRCGKNFNSEKERKTHIVSVHFKDKFSSIPKRQSSYKCVECDKELERRYHLIEHLVTVHKYITKQDLAYFIPGDGQQDLFIPGENGTEIDFNDSVSQLHLQRVNQQRKRMLALNILLRCPICDKTALNQTNFEDHLETHGIRPEPVLQCLVCSFAGSFAQQYYHVQQVHKDSDDIRIKCLCCQDKKSSCLTSDIDLANHCQTYVHTVKAANFDKDRKKQLHFTFRYSCVMCCLYFKSLEALETHLQESPDHKQMRVGQKVEEPSFKCHLCDMQKLSSKFVQHMLMPKHIYMVEQEADQHPEEYGLDLFSVLYSCETCRCAASYPLIKAHFKATCKQVKCGPCDELIQSHSSQALLEALRKHVHSDKHKNCVAEFISLPVSKFTSKYIYQCITCSFVFSSHAGLNNHNSSCPKVRYRCRACDVEADLCDGMSHAVSRSHCDNIARITPEDTESETLLVDLGPSPRESPSPTESEDLEIIPHSPDIIEEQVVETPPKRRTRDCETVVLDAPPLASTSHQPPAHFDRSHHQPSYPPPEESVIQISGPSSSSHQVSSPTRNLARPRGNKVGRVQPGFQQARPFLPPPSPSVVELIDEDVQEVQELQQHVQDVQEDVQEVQDIQEVQEVSHGSAAQFKKPADLAPQQRGVRHLPSAAQRARRHRAQAERHVVGRQHQDVGQVHRYPAHLQQQQYIQTPEQRLAKRKKTVFKCDTEGCTVKLTQDRLKNHAMSHLQRAHEVRIKCTVCHTAIQGASILTKLNGHLVNVKHKRNLICPAGPSSRL